MTYTLWRKEGSVLEYLIAVC